MWSKRRFCCPSVAFSINVQIFKWGLKLLLKLRVQFWQYSFRRRLNFLNDKKWSVHSCKSKQVYLTWRIFEINQGLVSSFPFHLADIFSSTSFFIFKIQFYCVIGCFFFQSRHQNTWADGYTLQVRILSFKTFFIFVYIAEKRFKVWKVKNEAFNLINCFLLFETL